MVKNIWSSIFSFFFLVHSSTEYININFSTASNFLFGSRFISPFLLLFVLNVLNVFSTLTDLLLYLGFYFEVLIFEV